VKYQNDFCDEIEVFERKRFLRGEFGRSFFSNREVFAPPRSGFPTEPNWESIPRIAKHDRFAPFPRTSAFPPKSIHESGTAAY
jgi:hypothetical protein